MQFVMFLDLSPVQMGRQGRMVCRRVQGHSGESKGDASGGKLGPLGSDEFHMGWWEDVVVALAEMAPMRLNIKFYYIAG